MFGGLPDATSSASGPAGALPDITSSQAPSTWKDLGPVTTTATAPEPTSPDAIAASTTILPTGEQPEGGRAVLLAEVEPGLTAQKEATHPPSETTLHPTTHSVSTARATMAPGPATSHPHRDVQPDHHETSAPTGRGRLEPHRPHVEEGGPPATEKAAEEDPSTQTPVGEGSGEQVGVRPAVILCVSWALGGPSALWGTVHWVQSAGLVPWHTRPLVL